MKQLLEVDSAQNVIVALHDKAYVGRLEAKTVTELPAPPPKEENNEAQLKAIQAVSLCATGNSNGSSETATALYCAVARQDKSLVIYQITEEEKDGGNNNSLEVKIVQTHHTSKRVSCLQFTHIVPEANDSPLILIAGDLTGDAIAYDVTSDKRRLLLGHTASMLTAAKVVTAPPNQSGASSFLITSDRDEKVRVSQFPATHVIEGFLLGHEAFVSCFDVRVKAPSDAASTEPDIRIVTCSGDGTVRLWSDRNSGTRSSTVGHQWEQDAIYRIVSSTPEASAQEEDGKVGTSLVPTKIRFIGNSNLVAVLFDECPTLSLLQLNTDASTGGLSLTAHSSIPKVKDGSTNGLKRLDLAVCDDLVLTIAASATKPTFEVFRATDGLLKQQTDTPFIAGLEQLLKGGVDIVMPVSILDRDPRSGQPCLEKQSETRTHNYGERHWNDAARIDIAKARGKRTKKRRKQLMAQKEASQGDE